MVKKIFSLLLLSFVLFQDAQAQAKPDWKTYNDTFNIYSVSYPPGLELRKIDYQNIFFVTPLEGADDKFQERLKLELGAAPQGYTLDSIAGLIQQQMKVSMKGEILLDPKIEDVKMGGQTAKRISGSGIMIGETIVVKITVTVALTKNAMLRASVLEAFDYKFKSLGLSGIGDGSLTPLEQVIGTIKFK